MPEGPSIVLLKEYTVEFVGQKIMSVKGNTKTIKKERLLNKRIIAIKSWGKHFLICFNRFTVKVHFLMFGSYLVNESKETPVRLSLGFRNGELNLYACSIKILEGNINDHYDWSGDVMNDQWDEKKAKSKLKSKPTIMVCDALLDQDIFGGVGNIIKNEVLFRIKVHPESKVGKLPAAKINEMISEARNYSFEFLDWKRIHVLRKHWLVHTKKTCPNCDGPITLKYTGTNKRRSFFCSVCQKLYK